MVPEAAGPQVGPGWRAGRGTTRTGRPLSRPRPGHGRLSRHECDDRRRRRAMSNDGETRKGERKTDKGERGEGLTLGVHASSAETGEGGGDVCVLGGAVGVEEADEGTAVSSAIRSARRQLLAPGSRGERGASFAPHQFARGYLQWRHGDGGRGDSTAAVRERKGQEGRNA